MEEGTEEPARTPFRAKRKSYTGYPVYFIFRSETLIGSWPSRGIAERSPREPSSIYASTPYISGYNYTQPTTIPEISSDQLPSFPPPYFPRTDGEAATSIFGRQDMNPKLISVYTNNFSKIIRERLILIYI